MSDYWLQEAERMGDESDNYASWVDSNEELIIEQYGLWLDDNQESVPEDVFEGVLDDDYPEAVENYIEGLTINKIPDDFINNMYENAMSGDY